MNGNPCCGYGGRGCECEDPKLRYVEQIAANKAGIQCLNGRVCRAEQDIRERYTKEEVDRMLLEKADKCAFEKHLLGHGGNGCCRPCDCNGSVVCDCDCYTKPEIDALLASKADGITMTGNIDLYVTKDGSDEKGTGEQTTPYLTIGRAVRDIHKYMGNFEITIFIGDGIYDECVAVSNKLGRVTLTSISRDRTKVTIRNYTDVGGGTAVLFQNVYCATINNVTLVSRTVTDGQIAAARFYTVSIGRIGQCNIVKENSGYGIHAASYSQLSISDVDVAGSSHAVVGWGSKIRAGGVTGQATHVGFYSVTSSMQVHDNTLTAPTLYSADKAGEIVTVGRIHV